MTLRWQKVIELAASGRTDKQIAAEMGLSPHTVETYWKRIRQRYQAPTRTSAVLAHYGLTPHLQDQSG